MLLFQTLYSRFSEVGGKGWGLRNNPNHKRWGKSALFIDDNECPLSGSAFHLA